jgi:glycosyltransferase involved in cell wall biosynthesis
VGIVGRLDSVKGHTHFIEAAVHVLRERPDARFAIAGKEAGLTAQLLRNQARALGLADSVIEFAGFVDSVEDFMRGCGLGVIASIGSEEISRAAIEWMATGRPLVGTLVGCLPEMIEPEETGLIVAPGDSTAMARAILRILNDRQLAEAWGRNGHAVTRQKLSPQTQLQRTLDVYNRAIAASR